MILIQKKPEAQPSETPCGNNCFLHKIDSQVLASMKTSFPSASVTSIGRISKKEKYRRKFMSKTSNPPALICIEDDSSEDPASSDSDDCEGMYGESPSVSSPSSCDEEESTSGSTETDTSKKCHRWKGQQRSGQGVKMVGKGNYGSSRKSEGDGNQVKQESIPEGWNGQEVTIFRMLKPIFGHNYCSMAAIISSKNCQQVRSYFSGSC